MSPTSSTPAINQLTLHAELIARRPLRYTPAGVPVFEGRLSHLSTQIEASQSRQCQLELACTAAGVLAETLDRWVLGSKARVEGFLAQSGLRRLPTLHIQSYAPII